MAERARMPGRSGAIPDAALVAGSAFAPRLSGARVIAAIERGLGQAGHEQVDLCSLEGVEDERGHGLRDLLAALDFDQRMRRARALIVAEQSLERSTLERSVAFELATRARQAGVPCYAITARNGLNAFDARMLDLQLTLEAGSLRALTDAGGRLAKLM